MTHLRLRERRRSDSSESSNDDKRRLRSKNASDDEQQDMVCTQTKRKKYSIWADEAQDRALTEALQGRSTQITGHTDGSRISRGPESFNIPTSFEFDDSAGDVVKLAVKQRTPAENPFADGVVNLNEVEMFGVPTTSTKKLPIHDARNAINRKRKQHFDAPGQARYNSDMHVSSSQSQYTNVRPTPPALRSIGAKLEHVELDPTVSCDMLADQLSSILHETNIELLRRCTRVVGNVACIALLRRVEAVELAGGMTTLDGRRRRTPGGVYLYLLRQDNMDTVTEAQLKEIFIEDRERNKKIAIARRHVQRGSGGGGDKPKQLMKFLDSLKQSVATGLQANGGDLRVKLTKKQTQDENKEASIDMEDGELSSGGDASSELGANSSRTTNTPETHMTAAVGGADGARDEEDVMAQFGDDELDRLPAIINNVN